MNQPDRLKIIQIIPVTKPLVAVFKDKESSNGIWTSEVYVIELIKNKDNFRYERGVISWDIELVDTDDIDDFLGYAKDEVEAIKLYGKKEQSDDLDDRKNKAYKAVREYQSLVNAGIVLDGDNEFIGKLCQKYNITQEVFEDEIRVIEKRILGE